MKITKTQILGKRLLISLLLVEIAAMGVGLSSPARSATLKTIQSTESTAKLQLISEEIVTAAAPSRLIRTLCRMIFGRRRC